MRISDWSSDVCSSDLITLLIAQGAVLEAADPTRHPGQYDLPEGVYEEQYVDFGLAHYHNSLIYGDGVTDVAVLGPGMIHGLGLRREGPRSEEHTSELHHSCATRMQSSA